MQSNLVQRLIKPEHIFNINTNEQFESCSLEIFKYQFDHNPVYRTYCDLLYVHPSDIKTPKDIPFLPISFFKTHEIVSSKNEVEHVFKSSGTTGKTSKHYITDLTLYENSFNNAFQHFYGNAKDYTILALLPSYLEQGNSSLVYMVDALIKKSNNPESGFYLDNMSELATKLASLDKNSSKKNLLIGVSFALLDLLELTSFELKNTIVMETGGMKGRRKELVKEALHSKLKKGFGVAHIHSEYGMTELLSQAYSSGKNKFNCPSWMKILIRDTEDALSILPHGTSGGINVIDLANINSCSFIATQDLGRSYEDGSFEVIGRFDHSDIRGCNLMVL